MVAGIAVNVLGHSHPAVRRALEEQSAQLIHTSNLYYTEPQLELAELLVASAFDSRVFFCNSGAEAIEGPTKLARKWGKLNRNGAHVIVCMDGAFHGRTLGALAATANRRYQEPFRPLPSGFTHVPFNDVDAVAGAIDASTCAVLLEPIEGESGIHPLDPGVLQQIRRVCDEQGVLLILDEVQSGMGRTGAWWAHQHDGVAPDIMTTAQGLGGGVPIGAILAAPRADVFEPGDHGCTFGGGPLACAAAIAVLSVIERDGLVGHAAEMGEALHEALLDLGANDVRGIGLMQAFEFGEPRAKAFQQSCLEAGLIVNAIDDHSGRLVSPLITGSAGIDRAPSTLRKER